MDKWQETFKHVIKIVADKKLCLMEVGARYDLSDVKKAIDILETSHTNKGKVFLISN